ncbi:MAG: right-handed parallel beta-helix repeat-containing protein [Ignavibacteriae bacterium]|nr:right-handed parallel beta-helix repeat-containing protein [Ignavibacteriota bacterium]MCB9216777.1 right-handed parallel beta-helix repeat-containing protein [Ignavibacteria bacterium]
MNRIFRTLISSLFFFSSITTTLAQLSGSYQVGPKGDFETLAKAAEALNEKGVDGATQFLIASGRYEEQFRISKVRGASRQNPITFESESGNPKDVTIFYQHLGASANNNEHVIRIDTTDFVTIQNLTIENPGEIYGTGIRAVGSASVTIRNTTIAITPNPTFAQPLNSCVYLFDAPNIVVENCQLSGGYAGVNGTGLSNTTPTLRGRIEGNTMSHGLVSQGGGGILMQHWNGLEIRRNRFSANDGVGIFLDNCNDGVRVEQNRITLHPERFGTALSMQACDGNEKRNLVANNLLLVIDADTATGVSGITMNGCRKTDIFYNTVHLSNSNTTRFQSTTNVAVSFFSFNNDSLRIFNNIFTNMRTREAILYPIGNATYESDFNNIYTTGDILGRTSAGNFPTLDSLQRSQGIESNSYSVSPCYSLRTDLHTNSETLDNAGIPLPEVTVDIDGNPRNPATPDIGAYEYSYTPSGLSGTYTIGQGGDYETLGEGIEDLHTRCVIGPVDFAFLDGEYTIYETINKIPGTSEENIVTLRSASEDAEQVLLQQTLSFSLGRNYLLRLRNVDHLHIQDLTFQLDDSTSTGTTIRFIGESNRVSITENIFDGSAAENSAMIFAGEDALTDSIRIERNRFIGGNSGIRLNRCFGFDCTEDDRGYGARIVGNIFRRADTSRAFQSPISIFYHYAPIIHGNDIESIGSGISLNECSGPLQVTSNRVDVRGSNFGSSSAAGISFGFADVTEPFGLIANNMVHVHDPVYIPDRQTVLTGINIGQAKNFWLLYNTIAVRDSASQSIGLDIPFGSDSILVQNNIIASFNGNPAYRIKFIERFNKTFDLDYNLIYTTGDTLAIWNDTGRVDLSSIQPILGSETHSVVADPQFLSEDDLHIATTSPAIQAGFPFNDFVFNDIDGELRNSVRPEIGADELEVVSVRNWEQPDIAQSIEELTIKPNYVHQLATISLRLTSRSQVRLSLVDLTGREVRLFAEREFPVGTSQITWSEVNVPSGFYWVQLEVRGHIKQERIIIAR